MSTAFDRRRFLQLTGAAGAVAASGSLLSACAAGGSGSGSSSGQTSFWYEFDNTQSQTYFQQHFVDDYNKTNPAAKAVLTVKPSADLDRLTQTALASGQGPDIVTAIPAQALSYVRGGDLLALDSYIDKYGWTQAFLPWALNAGRVDGKLYSLPQGLETLAMYYNPGTFAQHGWTAPTTRAEFEAICADAASKGIMPVAAGNADWVGASEWHVSWVWNSFAGPQALYEALTGKRKWTDPVFVDGIAMLKSWFDKGWFGGSTNNYFTNKFATLYQKLAAGQAAMMFTGTWGLTEAPPYFGSAAGNTATWDWAPLPSTNSGVAAGVYPLAVGRVFGVNKTTKNADAAAAYLNYLSTGPSLQLGALAAVGLQPTPIKVTPSEFPASTDPRSKRLYSDLSATQNYGYTTWTFWPTKTDTYIVQSSNKVFTGQLSPQDFCAGVDSQFQQELKAGSVPPVPPPTGV